MEKIITLNQSVRKLCIRDSGATFSDTILDKLTIEKLGHRKGFSDFTEEREKFYIFEPIKIINKVSIFSVDNSGNLSLDSGFIELNLRKRFQVTFAILFRVANLTGSSANKKIRLVAVTNKTSAHHKSSKISDC